MSVEIWNAAKEAKWLRNSWIKQFGDCSDDARTLASKLQSLGDDPTPAKIDKTFASHAPLSGYMNQVQRAFSCDSCGKEFRTVLRVNSYSDGQDWSSIDVCELCLASVGFVRKES